MKLHAELIKQEDPIHPIVERVLKTKANSGVINLCKSQGLKFFLMMDETYTVISPVMNLLLGEDKEEMALTKKETDLLSQHYMSNYRLDEEIAVREKQEKMDQVRLKYASRIKIDSYEDNTEGETHETHE